MSEDGPGRLILDPWRLREDGIAPEDSARLGRAESLFALSNGHLGLRGNLDEGEPHEIPGTYLGSFYEQRPLPYPEAGYGYPEMGQTIVNVTNGKPVRLLVDDSPFDIRYGTLRSHQRELDLRAGVLRREADWRSPAGQAVRVRSTRLVSFTQRAVAAICYEVQPLEQECRIILQSQLVTNEAPPAQPSADPRVAAALDRPLAAVTREVGGRGAILLHRTRASGLLLAAGMSHELAAPDGHSVDTAAGEDWARTTVVCALAPGQTLRLVKYLGYGWSGHRSEPAVRDQVAAALAGGQHTGWEGLLREQRDYLDRFWEQADVEIDGDAELQHAVRFALFHVLQAGARAERRGIAAKGLTGPGYDGHAFWDTEGFVLPVLTLTAPHAAADALRWRASLLPQAKTRAAALDLAGAAFPWRTIDGAESGAYWPAGTAAFHINADIARAFEDYRQSTGDAELERECGLSVLVETARLWHSIGHHDRDGRWHIDGVTGPDEYTAVVNDNVFTNLMAARNLTAAADACDRNPDLAEQLAVTAAESAAWRADADAVHVGFDAELGVHPQSESFTRYAEWDLDGWDGRYPLMLHAPYFQLYRKQVVKQADLVLAMHWCSEAFTDEQKARNLDYYESRTVRDSSLSAGTQAILCAEVGHLDRALAYLREAALMDLRDLHHNTRSGLHLACLASTWAAVVEGLGGLRRQGETLRLAPALPEPVAGLRFRLRWRGRPLLVDVGPREVRCALADPAATPLSLVLYDEPVDITGTRPAIRPTRRRAAPSAAPPLPPGREPLA